MTTLMQERQVYATFPGVESGFVAIMERYQTMRAYSAGGVVFRLAPVPLPDRKLASTVAKQEQDVVTGRHTLHIATYPTYPYASSIQMEVALVGRRHAGIWSLPKGTPRPGETIEQVAMREVQEETGLQVRLIAYIGSISYSFIRDQIRYYKQVRHFLLEAIGGDTALHDHEYDIVSWFPLPEACRRLTYQNEVNILYQAEETLLRWLQRQHKEGLK
jgi:8-oxo-dGTP pyrophosphatase MutT (NUDIX family)